MNKASHWIFAVAIGLLVSVVGGLILYQEYVLTTGDTTILATRPIDPRDLFRGEYVILRYEIESDERVRTVAQDLPDNADVFVFLVEDEQGIARVVSASAQSPRASDVSLWIRGRVQNGLVRFPAIEQFYVPEGSGTPIERLGSGIHVTVVLADGEARAIGLLDDTLQPIDPREYIE
jgi:uncharacterized membrane-anchored protein